MIIYVFKSAIRSLGNKVSYNILQVIGLAVGLSSAGLVSLYVHHELSYDRFHPQAAYTYRVIGLMGPNAFPFLAAPYSDYIIEAGLPGIENAARVRRWQAKYMYYAEKKFYEEKVLFTDVGSRFFDIFNYSFIYGDSKTALSSANSVVITKSIARKYFGALNPLGEVLRLDTTSLIITGVIEDIPSNTHLDFDFLISHSKPTESAWGAMTYVVLNKHVDKSKLEAAILDLQVNTTMYNQADAISLQELSNLHFINNTTFELKPPGNKIYLWVFVGIGLVILIVAFTNYLNLSIALYADKAKEIAIRKINGANQLQLASQFIAESFVVVFSAILLTMICVQVILPFFNQMVGTRLENHFINTSHFIYAIMLAGLVMVLASGLYPALILPKLQVQALFKNKGLVNNRGLATRKYLLIIQFTIMMAILSAVWLINLQLDFVLSKNLGFQKEGVIKINRAWTVDSTRYWRIKYELLKNPSVVAVSEGRVPGDEDYGFAFRAEGSEKILEGVLSLGTDYDYLRVLGIQCIDCQAMNLAEKQPGRAVFINETLASQLGYDNAVGRKLVALPGTEAEREETIFGVFEDYHYFSLHQPIAAQVLYLYKNSKYVDSNIIIRVDLNNIAETLTFIQSTLDDIVPDIPLGISFLDEDIQKFYKEESKLAAATFILLIISVIMVLAGITGLTSYMVKIRTAEIGIRKVLGASVLSIHKLFLHEFGAMILWAFPLAALISYYTISYWLDFFAYRILINYWVFLGTIFIVFSGTAFICNILVQKIALSNPVDALRSE